MLLPFHKILCPTDFSARADEAITAAAELAACFNAELYLLHVVPPAPRNAPMPDGLGALEPDITQLARQDAKVRLHEIRARCLSSGVWARCLTRHGDPALEILRAAEDEGCDLIVIATRGTSNWQRWLGSSVAEDQVRLAPCPVLALHARVTTGAQLVAGPVVGTNPMGTNPNDAAMASHGEDG